jgi:hypothetical protein
MPITIGRAAATNVTFTTPQEIIISESDDSIAVFGYDGTTNRALKTNTRGEIVTQSAEAVQLDEVGSTTYIGYAAVGTSVASAAWRIKRIVDSSGDLSVTFAGGTDNYDQIWNNRAGLTYT